ncbi:MAG: PAS domain-containing protein [Alphaproteobacteria bacterium]
MAGPERDESRQLLKHWRRFRGEKRLPDQDDIRLDDLAPYMHYIFIYDVEAADRFIVKQASSGMLERINGKDLRGLNILDLINPIYRERFIERVQLIFEFGYASCTHTGLPSADGGFRRIENMVFPVENTAGGFRQIFGTVYYTDGMSGAGQSNSSFEDVVILDESFIDLGSGYAAVIDARDLPFSTFPQYTGPRV